MKVGLVLWGSVNSTSTQLYVCPHRKLLSGRLVQATANLCAGFMFVYIHIYIFIEVPTEMAGNYTDI